MIEPGEYGVVRVSRGRFKGRLGYYDDDDGARAIVYLSGPPTLAGSSYELIRFSSLEAVSDADERRWLEENMNDIKYARARRVLRGTVED